MCIVLLVAGCSNAPGTVCLDDLPAIPGLSLYEGAEEIVLDRVANALRTAIDDTELEAEYYWDPNVRAWDELVASFGSRIEPEGWAADKEEAFAGVAVWTRATQRLVLAEIPQLSGGRIIALFLAAP